ncbi:membrane protein insertion efficiency factor YidD [Maioricimonas sp. JC845]|uniref:membrane protein insertion efficiency factor YidD n=1 Tax=Maioricimonas sp. JC845 TaxID=3232138 RepID=UPI003457E7F7
MLWLRTIARLPAQTLILLVRGYQIFLSPLIGQHCRFTPSCSQYFIEAVRKYGAIRGAAKGVWRICRCHPFCQGGYDPP